MTLLLCRSKAHPKYHPLSVIALVQAHFLEVFQIIFITEILPLEDA